MQILLVEDEPLIAMSLCAELEDAGHDVIGPATSIESALALVRAHRVELALLDIDLQHRGDGIVLAKRMREMDIPTLFVSGQFLDAHDNADLALGYISKPCTPSDVARSIAVIDARLHGLEPPPPAVPAALELFH
jgi:DNA-binding response OmpR family regulator